ncbi:ABC transporter ATP-binding protein [Microbacterium sp.]|uniref:ABC transporter ATP-binding protein n=1 Tax=Microbacterium sp. TaxID=51671 RepID=UPI003A8B8840
MLGLELTGVSRSFGGREVLHSVDLTVARGEIVGFIGGNGAGKTTTMRLILGLLTASGGQITWNEKPITVEARRAIGYMPEERGLYPEMTVDDQLVHFALLEGSSLSEARDVARELIGVLGLAGRERSRVQDLSLGNQQRVQLGVALVGNPALLVLDEPFSGLDPLAVETMAGLLREQARRGVGVLFSSHQLELVERICDRVCVLDHGEVVATGRVDDLQDDSVSRWRLTFSRDVDEILAAELSLIPGVVPAPVADEPRSIMITVDGHGDDIPDQVLGAALRRGGLRSIEQIQRSLAEILTERLGALSATAPDAIGDTRQLAHIGGKP